MRVQRRPQRPMSEPGHLDPLVKTPGPLFEPSDSEPTTHLRWVRLVQNDGDHGTRRRVGRRWRDGLSGTIVVGGGPAYLAA
jgi:hypothetical protein